MFGIFKKKHAVGDEKRELAGKVSVMFIQNQLDLADVKGNKAAASRVMSLYSLGYIFGHADAHAQKAGMDEMECMANITVTHVMLFGKELGPKVTRTSMDVQKDQNFNRGRQLGASDAMHWYSEKDFVPLSLQSYLVGETR